MTRPRVLITRAREQADDLATELLAAGLEPVLVPTIAIELEPPGGALDRCARRIGSYRWVVASSANGARAIVAAVRRAGEGVEATRWAVIGPATRRFLESIGVAIAFQPRHALATALAEELPIESGDRILVVRGDLADEALALGLRARGAEVDDVVAYRTREAPQSSRRLLREAVSDEPIAAVVFTSGSTVRGLVALARVESIDVLAMPSICIGPETADEARAAGFGILAISATPESAAVAETSAIALAVRSEVTS
jgi:uroporphyrinogen III methyltransferase/synthase